MSFFLDGLGKVFGKVADQFQGRVERLKNERTRLLDERKKLMDAVVTPTSACHIIDIDIRVREINETLNNKATD